MSGQSLGWRFTAGIAGDHRRRRASFVALGVCVADCIASSFTGAQFWIPVVSGAVGACCIAGLLLWLARGKPADMFADLRAASNATE